MTADAPTDAPRPRPGPGARADPRGPAMDYRCPLCRDAMAPWLSMPIDPKKESPCAHGRAFRCRGCSFGMIQPRPEEAEIGDFYALEHYYTHGRSHFADGGAPSLPDRVRAHLAWRLDRGEWLTAEMAHGLLGGRPSEVCDMGCGNGHFAARMSDLGHRVAGVEVDTRAAVEARQKGVDLHDGSVEHLPGAVASRRFDLVVMSHVLEHVLDPVKAVEAMAGLLRPGGIFACVVPNNASAGLARSGLSWEPLDIPRHLNFFVPENLRAVGDRAGLKTRRLFFSGYCRQFENGWINTERRIWDALARHGGPPAGSSRNSPLRAWGLLARTAFAAKGTKYDSVGIIAEKP